MVKMYIDGGVFMHPILFLWIVGIAVVIERFWTLTRASVNTRKFLARVRLALEQGGVAAATAECERTPGPVASIFHAGLSRWDKGISYVEKAISTAGALEMAFLERGMIILNTVITLAPMFGFTGTVWGMIFAFDAIKVANDISPAIVASGISQALLTTLFGLVVAMSIQIFTNYFLSRIDKLIVDMEESSVELIETLADLEVKKK
jgi:biopolymer transport protein ExbB